MKKAKSFVRLKKISEYMKNRSIKSLDEGSKYIVFICTSCGFPSWAYGESKTSNCKNCNRKNKMENATIVLKTDIAEEAMLTIQMLKTERRIDFSVADVKPKIDSK